jgi:hypothetical protein
MQYIVTYTVCPEHKCNSVCIHRPPVARSAAGLALPLCYLHLCRCKCIQYVTVLTDSAERTSRELSVELFIIICLYALHKPPTMCIDSFCRAITALCSAFSVAFGATRFSGCTAVYRHGA